MHPQCFELFKPVGKAAAAGSKVLDVGSYDVNGTLKPLFQHCRYTGCDIGAGPNVDVVQTLPHVLPFDDNAFDVVVSANCLEHCKRPWELVLEMDRVLKPGGTIAVSLPWVSIGYHPYPIDCYRITTDAMTELFGPWMVEHRRPGYTVRENKFGSMDTFFWGMKKMNLENMLNKPVGEVLKAIQDRAMSKTHYMGIHTFRSPFDTWIYQELITEQKPDVIIEVGVAHGGQTLWLAHLCDALGHGRVIGIDVGVTQIDTRVPKHPRVTIVQGDAPKVVDKVTAAGAKVGLKTLVIEDSAHTYENTLAVLTAYSPFVHVGGYIIVEDTICHHGLEVGPKPGPMEAVDAWLEGARHFARDSEREPVITWNPGGYLRRVR